VADTASCAGLAYGVGVAAGDGNGWVRCRCGQRHWGLHGAAGLLLVREAQQRQGDEVLLQLRAEWTHQGGTWGIPGGAVDSHEDEVTGALREAHEEAGVPPSSVRVLRSVLSTDHGDWTYHVVVGVPAGPMWPSALTAESDDVRWVAVDDVGALPLHPGFGTSWPRLRGQLSPGQAGRAAQR
jgi:8-oxo-dGTP diphosphatase